MSQTLQLIEKSLVRQAKLRIGYRLEFWRKDKLRKVRGKLSDIIRDFKKYTAKRIIEAIASNQKESRQKWLLWLLKKDNHIWFWEEGYHGEEIQTKDFFDSKVLYMHLNPVRAGLVEKEEEYLLSSCGDFYGIRKGAMELTEF